MTFYIRLVHGVSHEALLQELRKVGDIKKSSHFTEKVDEEREMVEVLFEDKKKTFELIKILEDLKAVQTQNPNAQNESLNKSEDAPGAEHSLESPHRSVTAHQLLPYVHSASVSIKMLLVGEHELRKLAVLRKFFEQIDPKEPPAASASSFFIFSEPTPASSSSSIYFNTFVDLNGLEVNVDLWELLPPDSKELTAQEKKQFHDADADVVLAMFSVIKPSTFHSLKNHWMEELKKKLVSTPILLVGIDSQKRDQHVATTAASSSSTSSTSSFLSSLSLTHSQQHPSTVVPEEAVKYAKDAGLLTYAECGDDVFTIEQVVRQALHVAIGDFHYGKEFKFYVTHIACEGLVRSHSGSTMRSSSSQTIPTISPSSSVEGEHLRSPGPSSPTSSPPLPRLASAGNLPATVPTLSTSPPIGSRFSSSSSISSPNSANTSPTNSTNTSPRRNRDSTAGSSVSPQGSTLSTKKPASPLSSPRGSHSHHAPTPYVKIITESKKKEVQTSSVAHSTNPTWNNLDFSFSNKDVGKYLEVVVRHHRQVLKDEFIGVCHIPVNLLYSNFLEKGQICFTATFPLRGKDNKEDNINRGKLTITFNSSLTI